MATEHIEKKTVMIDATYLKPCRTATSLGVKWGGEDFRLVAPRSGMHTELHAVRDSKGRPISVFFPAGQANVDIGARALLSRLPNVEWLLGDRGYVADWFQEALQDKGIRPSFPGRKSLARPVRCDRRRYKRRNYIEIMFGRFKDWRRVATRNDRCPKVFVWAIALAVTVIYWLWFLTLNHSI